MTVLAALLLPVLMATLALVLDGGRLLVARVRAQTVADAAALAAASEVGRWRIERNGNQDRIDPARLLRELQRAARAIAEKNAWPAAPGTLMIHAGRWDSGTHRVREGRVPFDAVEVRVQGTLRPWLGQALGISTLTVSAQAAATLSPLGVAAPTAIALPLGLARAWFRAPVGSASLETGDRLLRCASRVALAPGDAILASASSGPVLVARHSSVLVQEELTMAQVNQWGRTRGQGKVTSLVPVLEAGICPIPRGWQRIVGFATVQVTLDAAKPIQMNVLPDRVVAGSGRAEDFGTKGTMAVLMR